jgi:hypothetical protein
MKILTSLAGVVPLALVRARYRTGRPTKKVEPNAHAWPAQPPSEGTFSTSDFLVLQAAMYRMLGR